MKKIFVLMLVSIMITGGLYAQKNKRTSAYNYNKEFDNSIEMFKLKHDKKSLAKAKESLNLAKENIEPTITHEKTMNDPKTWLYRGIIYYNIAHLPLDADSAGKMDTEAAKIAFESLNKAKELDAKNRYKTDIDLFLQNLYTLYFSSGASNYNDKNYEDAKNNLIAAFKVQEARGVFDTTAAYYAGVTSLMDKDADGTIEYMKKCSEVDYNNPQVYIFWSQAWKIKGDTTQALNVLKDGRTKYPEELSILKEEAQTYLEKGENKKLIESLLKAIEKEPDNANMLFLLAQAYSNEGDDVNAEVYYKKSLEVKPDFFEAYYNIAAIYNNKASALIKEANELPLEESEKYNKLIGEADGFLKQALPWLEKSYELKPDDVYTKHALKEAYTRLKMYEKAKALND
jgi:hypothetical protein